MATLLRRWLALHPEARARAWFGAQAVAGALWWAAVALSPDVRRWTLGSWSPALLAVPDLLLFVGGSALAAWRGQRAVAVVVAGWTTAVTAALVAWSLVTGEAGWGAFLMVAASAGTLAATAVLWWGRLPLGWFFRGPFAFREAPEAPPRHHLARSLAQVVVFWSSLLVGLPLLLSWAEERMGLAWPLLDSAVLRWAGAGLFLVAGAVALWACAAMSLRGAGTPLPAATASRLVVSGPYRWVRNPMAVCGALQTVAVGLWLGSWLVVVSAVVGCVVWDRFIRPTEEADLADRLGLPYLAYRDEVRCWVPARTVGQRATNRPGAAPRVGP